MHEDSASSSAAPASAEHTSSLRTLASVEDAVKGTLLWAKADDEWPWWPAEVVGRGPDDVPGFLHVRVHNCRRSMFHDFAVMVAAP